MVDPSSAGEFVTQTSDISEPWGPLVIDFSSTPVYTTPIPNQGPDKPELSLIGASFAMGVVAAGEPPIFGIPSISYYNPNMAYGP